MYKYDTHLHTKHASACGLLSGSEQAYRYKEAGYDGIFITDHFFRGNSNIPKHITWEERIILYCKGYEEAKKTGDQIGLKVFFGYEETFEGTDFLIYGPDKEWLLNHPEIEFISIKDQFKLIDNMGWIVIHAHPFRDRHYIPQIRLFPNQVHGVEVINSANYDAENERAFKYAKEYNLPMTAGSDNHTFQQKLGGIKTQNPIESIDDYIKIIKNNEKVILI